MKNGVGADEGLIDDDGAVEFMNEGVSDERNEGCVDGAVELFVDESFDGEIVGTGSTLSDVSASLGNRGGFVDISFETKATAPTRRARDTISRPIATLFFRSP